MSRSALLLAALVAASSHAAPRDLGGGYRDHGVASPFSTTRGTVCLADGLGREIALSWLMDHRGCYGLLIVDVASGECRTLEMPFDWQGDAPFASILSTRGRFYSLYGSQFVEVDPTERKVSFHASVTPRAAMSMTEDDEGRIWAATYPSSGLVCYEPGTGRLHDFGSLYAQSWQQYPRALATDDSGWVYLAVGSAASQLLAFDPHTKLATPLLAEAERRPGYTTVFRDANGKCYGSALSGDEAHWLELYRGVATPVGAAKGNSPQASIAGNQGLSHPYFPSGRRLLGLNTIEKQLTVVDVAGAKPRTVPIEYQTDGAHIMSVCAGPEGALYGGTDFPMRLYAYQPATQAWTNAAAFGQFNTVAADHEHVFVGGYTHGFLLDWLPHRPLRPTVRGAADSNPLLLAENGEIINRPHDLLLTRDGRWVVLAGTPGYGKTGGGLYLWNRVERTGHQLTHEQLLPQQSTMSLAEAADGTLVGGSTIAAGTGGQVKADVAELYLFDLNQRQIVWHAPLLAKARSYTELWAAPNGIVYGVADGIRLFAFDPARRAVLSETNLLAAAGRLAGGQGPRSFVASPEGRIYLLLTNGVAELNPATSDVKRLSTSPVTIGTGGAWQGGRLWFVSGSHLYSWAPAT